MLAFAGEGGVERWLLIGDDGGIARGEGGSDLPPVADGRTALAVPGEAVAIHWLALDEGLAPAQAAAAARLMLADASLAPLADMHVASGRSGGRADAGRAGAERADDRRGWRPPKRPGSTPIRSCRRRLLLPAAGRRRWRGGGGARSPIIAGQARPSRSSRSWPSALVGDAAVADLDDSAFEAGLAEALAAPALNLRQGAFARRRRLRVVEGSWRRLAAYGLALAALTLVIQIAAILSYTFAADRLENEIAARGQSGAPARSAQASARSRACCSKRSDRPPMPS